MLPCSLTVLLNLHRFPDIKCLNKREHKGMDTKAILSFEQIKENCRSTQDPTTRFKVLFSQHALFSLCFYACSSFVSGTEHAAGQKSVALKHSQLANQPAITQPCKYVSGFKALLNTRVSCRKVFCDTDRKEQFSEPFKKSQRASGVSYSTMVKN